MASRGNTEEQGGRWNKLTRTWGRANTAYAHTLLRRLGYRRSEEGKGPVREGTEKQWKNTLEELKSEI